jgi:hypothetical protein
MAMDDELATQIQDLADRADIRRRSSSTDAPAR